MEKARVVRPLVDDPVLVRLYAEWQQEDPAFASHLEASRIRLREQLAVPRQPAKA